MRPDAETVLLGLERRFGGLSRPKVGEDPSRVARGLVNGTRYEKARATGVAEAWATLVDSLARPATAIEGGASHARLSDDMVDLDDLVSWADAAGVGGARTGNTLALVTNDLVVLAHGRTMGRAPLLVPFGATGPGNEAAGFKDLLSPSGDPWTAVPKTGIDLSMGHGDVRLMNEVLEAISGTSPSETYRHTMVTGHSTLARDPGAPARFTYAGHEEGTTSAAVPDRDVALFDAAARYFAPVTGRWIRSSEWIERRSAWSMVPVTFSVSGDGTLRSATMGAVRRLEAGRTLDWFRGRCAEVGIAI